MSKKGKNNKDNLFIKGWKKTKELAGDVKAGSGTILNVYKRGLTTSPRQNILKAVDEIEQHQADKLKKEGRTYTKAQNKALRRKVRDETVADVQARNKKQVKEHVSKKNADWERMRKGKMKKIDFIRKYPNSGTARRHMANMNPVQKRKFLASLKK